VPRLSCTKALARSRGGISSSEDKGPKPDGFWDGAMDIYLILNAHVSSCIITTYIYTYIYLQIYTLCTVYLTMQSPLFVGNVVIYRWLYPHCLSDKTYDMARMTWPARPAKASWPWLSPQPGTVEVLVMGRSAGPFTVLVPAKIAQFRMNL
jgi:hypothetical protein